MDTDDPAYRGLLRHVLAAPDDDTPRLILADWLAENGEPKRSKWVRVGVWLHMPIIHAPGCWNPWDCRHTELNPGRKPGGPQWVWDRGFLTAADCPTDWFLTYARLLFTTSPVTRVGLDDRSPMADEEHTTWFWSCATDGTSGTGWYLPESIFGRMLPDPKCRYVREHVNYYESERDALDGLSLACVRLGRSSAGLTCQVCKKLTPEMVGDGCCPACYSEGWVVGRRGWRQLGVYDG